MKKSLAIGLLAVTSLLSAPAAMAGARIYVRIGPPVPVVEAQIVAPGPGYVWVGGYHRWDGAAYGWVPGHWVLPPAHRTVWVGGHWAQHHSRGWYWVEGRWR